MDSHRHSEYADARGVRHWQTEPQLPAGCGSQASPQRRLAKYLMERQRRCKGGDLRKVAQGRKFAVLCYQYRRRGEFEKTREVERQEAMARR